MELVNIISGLNDFFYKDVKEIRYIARASEKKSYHFEGISKRDGKKVRI